MPDILMGIDIGTSSAKVLLVDKTGNILGIKASQYDIQFPQTGFAEQDIDFLWVRVSETIKSLLCETGIPPEEIKGIGLSGQMHGLVALDRNSCPIRPTIIWVDQRSTSQISQLDKEIIEKFKHTTLNTPGTGFYFASLLWMKENETQNYQRISTALSPKDYIRYKMCGNLATDETDASGTLIFNTAKREWATELAQDLGLDSSIFPECLKSYDIGGTVTKECAESTGLAVGTPVVVGGGDNPMQSIGNGMIAPGEFCSNIGTGSQLSCIIDSPAFDPKFRSNTFCHSPPNTWTLLGASLNGGLALKWFCENVLRGCGYSEIDTYAQSVNPGSDGIVFLPYLAGERFPLMDSSARGAFQGLSINHDYRHLSRAVMEGTVYSLKEALELFNEMGIPCERIIASGGGAKSPIWLQIQADIFGREIYTTRCKEEACLGAAITAGVGVGLFRDYREACDSIVKYNSTVTEPIMENMDVYNEQYQRYRSISVL